MDFLPFTAFVFERLSIEHSLPIKLLIVPL